MKTIVVALGLCLLVAAGCAQVPKESIELSTTVGRDLAVTHEAHIELATLLFGKMKQDVNRFVDETYAPSQIRAAMARQKALAESSDPNDRRKSLLLAINAAFAPDARPELQSQVLIGMEGLVTRIRNDIEDMRRGLLAPLEEQERQVILAINQAYQQIHYANSIVTGHLSSIARVHDAQSEVLEALGIEKDLRKALGEGIAGVSSRISTLVDKTEIVEDRIEAAEETARLLKAAIAELGKVSEDNH